MSRLEQIGVKLSGEKRGKLERSENIMETEKSHDKTEKKIVGRISEQRVRKLLRRRSEQAV